MSQHSVKRLADGQMESFSLIEIIPYTLCFFPPNKEIRNGVSFELPRNSLLKAIRLKIFDDLLIGNFMKTTLHNLPNLYYKNLKYVIANWSDNGGVDTEEELHKYITSYKEKAGREFLYDIFLDNSKNIFFRFISKNNKSILYRFAKKIYQNLK